MPDINVLIISKLKEHPARISEVAIEAIRWAQTLPPRALEAQLQNVLRRIVRREGAEQ